MSPDDLTLLLWGMLGSLLREARNLHDSGKAPPMVNLVVRVLISGFCGIVAAKVVKTIEVEWMVAAAVLAGYLGVETFNLALGAISSRDNRGR